MQQYFNVSSDFGIYCIVLDPRMKLSFYEDAAEDAEWNMREKAKIKDKFKGF